MFRLLSPLLLLLACALCARAQGHGGGGRMGAGGMRPGGMGAPGIGGLGLPRDGFPGRGAPEGNVPRGSAPPSGGNSPRGGMRGLQLGPPGRWWDDKKFAKSLGLNGDQQKRMDAVFGQNRDALLSRYENLQSAQGRLEALTRSGNPAESALFTEIDRVAQARADLEKVNTHYLLQLREEMTPEQIGKLDDLR